MVSTPPPTWAWGLEPWQGGASVLILVIDLGSNQRQSLNCVPGLEARQSGTAHRDPTPCGHRLVFSKVC